MKSSDQSPNKPSEAKPSEAAVDPAEQSDHVWGAEAIGVEIGRTANQVYHLYRSGALRGVVRKAGHRTFLGSRRKLRELVTAE